MRPRSRFGRAVDPPGMDPSACRVPRTKLRDQVRGDRLHAEAACLALGVAVVVRVGVDVVRVELAVAVGDEFDARDADAVVRDEAAIALDDRVRKSLDDPKARRSGRRCRFADRAESIVDLTDVRRAELEAERCVDTHCVEEFSADELDARDEGLGRFDVLLDQRDAVDRVLERVAVDVARQRTGVVEKPHAETLAGAVVFGDEATRHRFRGVDDRVASDRGDRARNADAVPGKCCVLRDLADFQRKGASVVDHAPAMRLEPREQAAGQLRGVTVSARMRRCAHPIVEHALRWNAREIERALCREPFGIRQAQFGECRPQRLDPGVVFVNHVDSGHDGPFGVRRQPSR